MKKPIPFGKYDLLERINVGGMAEVFRAKAYGVEGFERLVAVKRILPNIAEDKDFITMFIDEAKIAVQLNHANIAQIFDLGVVESSYFIALEHVHGRDLRAIFERAQKVGEPMPVAQACFIVMKLCEGLDYAHQKRDSQGRDMNLVHRDVSPQNILVSFEGEIKIIDFGIAKAAGKVSRTQAGILKGKFGYMSPEQVRGLPIDRRSDIFATGIVLYELLTNERLFVGESDFETLEKVRNVEILPPSTYNRKIPDELERIVLKALAKDIDDRYANAIDLHDELQAFVYTAGEFYSRKDLAAWMKRTFTREIEEEAAKIESYRQVPPRGTDSHDTLPDQAPAPASQQRITQSHRRATLASAAVPPPAAAAQLSPQASPQPPPQTARPRRITVPPPLPAAAFSPPPVQPRAAAPRSLEWDDDELETQIYDQPPDREPEPPQAPRRSSRSRSVAASASDSVHVSMTEKPSRTSRTSSNGTVLPVSTGGAGREPSYEARGTIVPDITVRRPRAMARPWIVAAIGVAVLAGLVLGGYSMFSGGGGKTPRTVADVDPPRAEPATFPAVDPATGFDIASDPIAARVVLDGRDIGPAPLRVRSLLAGKHQIELRGLTGYKTLAQEIDVEPGKALQLSLKLESDGSVPVAVAPAPQVTPVPPAAVMAPGPSPSPSPSSSPPPPKEVAAPVPAPVPTKQTPAPVKRATTSPPALPSRPVARPRPVPASAAVAKVTTPESARTEGLVETKPASERQPPVDSRPPVAAAASAPTSGTSFLTLGAKPPCSVLVNGQDTGKTTPVRDLEVKSGSVSVTLVNSEFGIRESFTLSVAPGENKKVIKDYSDRLPK